MAGGPSSPEDVQFRFPNENSTNKYQTKIFLNGEPFAEAEGFANKRIDGYFSFAPSTYKIFKVSGWIKRIE